MAEGEFWLPSDFLSDDFSDDKTVASLSSPLDSESDEDDTLAGLTRQMADNILNPPQTVDLYPKTMASSPQSTLCPGGIWGGSNNGSPTGSSQLSSPPETPLEQRKGDIAWDIPPPPIGGGGDATRGGGGGFVAPEFYKSQQAERFYHLQQQQLIKQQLSAAWGRQQHNRAKSGGAPLGLPLSAWPPLGKQQQHHHHPPPPPPPQSRSGFRAVFLTGPGQRESTGTGVFLPRRPGTPAELRKKPPCSTVLLPDRVIQALNLKLDEIGHHQPRFAVNHARGNQFPVQQQNQGYYRVAPSSTPAVVGGNVEVSLPAEWTY